jgi:REP element-mobilizing transposase RayT
MREHAVICTKPTEPAFAGDRLAMSYTNLLFHIVFATKGRLPMISVEIRPRFHQYMGGIVRGSGGIALELGGIEDHVHLLLKLKAIACSPHHTLSRV